MIATRPLAKTRKSPDSAAASAARLVSAVWSGAAYWGWGCGRLSRASRPRFGRRAAKRHYWGYLGSRHCRACPEGEVTFFWEVEPTASIEDASPADRARRLVNCSLDEELMPQQMAYCRLLLRGRVVPGGADIDEKFALGIFAAIDSRRLRKLFRARRA